MQFEIYYFQFFFPTFIIIAFILLDKFYFSLDEDKMVCMCMSVYEWFTFIDSQKYIMLPRV